MLALIRRSHAVRGVIDRGVPLAQSRATRGWEPVERLDLLWRKQTKTQEREPGRRRLNREAERTGRLVVTKPAA